MEKEKLFCKGGGCTAKAWRRHFKSCIVEATAGSER